MRRSRPVASTRCCLRKSSCSKRTTDWWAGTTRESRMTAKDHIDQDALAAEWGVALEADALAPPQGADAAVEGSEAAASQWAAMVDDGSNFMRTAKGGAERV